MSSLRLRGKSSQCHRTRTHHFTGWEMQTRAVTWERSPELSLTLQFSFLWQSQASEMTSESAGYFKAQLSNSPPNNIFNVDLFKTGFLILSKRLTCCDRRVRGFGGSSESLTPAQLSACILHNHAWDTWDKVSGMERSPRRVFYPLQHLWLLCVTGNWGEHQLQRF